LSSKRLRKSLFSRAERSGRYPPECEQVPLLRMQRISNNVHAYRKQCVRNIHHQSLSPIPSEEPAMSEHITSEPTTSNSGRESDGRFAKGNKFGPGNPFARKVAAFRAALMEAVTEQDIKDIAAKLRDDAKAGDKAAVKLLFQYVIGKPQPAVDPDSLDVQEMRGYMAAAFPPEVLEEMQRGLPLSMLLKMWPFFLFAKEQTNAERAGQQAAKHDEKQCRRAERAQRRQRRQQAQQAQPKSPPVAPSPEDDNGQASAATTEAPPSTDGDHASNGFAHGHHAPSVNGDIGDHTLKMILNWLRRQRGSSNGEAQP
jgi:hypothetical protein